VQLSGKADGLQAELVVVEQKIALHQKTLARMKKLEEDRELLETQIGIIDKLKAESSLTVRVLDEVARIIPSQRMWLGSLSQQGSRLSLSGMALDNRTIAGFMEELKQSPYIKSVTLANASLKAYAGRDLKLFSLSSAVGMPAKEGVVE
jgi:type IV pilus assembly protein PilN